jgi:hypothetical protein
MNAIEDIKKNGFGFKIASKADQSELFIDSHESWGAILISRPYFRHEC